GRIIRGVRLGKTDFIDNPAALERELPGQRIESVNRWGKFIVLPLSRGEANGRLHLLIHLGMTGRLAHAPADAPAPKHTHVRFELEDGRELRFTDPRRFGRIALLAGADVPAFVARLGREPLEISEQEFLRMLAARRTMIKALLLDQRRLRGIGNIYADESLWRARLHPRRVAAQISPRQAKTLFRAIRHVLEAAIRAGGSTISDYVNASGERGFFQLRHRVYDREGKPCFRCKTKIRRILVAGRSSHFCPRCQPPPRR
ncbi:MAG TPA: bifunctional DNA-formamidopyrimidine glycosylase/DNA-(apurinic or apyrimidinic site) lyase, partial [Candidatus Nitrosotenuis sp.]|nr:bifunctional DNA-formamidopyrimidine glycosylase/DNA-(apurinic or apyrimidinic site) lyase [Candidatus Nitrosotenuis sp.]